MHEIVGPLRSFSGGQLSPQESRRPSIKANRSVCPVRIALRKVSVHLLRSGVNKRTLKDHVMPPAMT